MIYEKAYAKINLALAVGKQLGGYHEVQNVMVPIQLYDELFLEKSKENHIESNIEIERNLCEQAVLLFQKKYSISEGVSIRLKKNIPMMAGLAGGSTDAAATLRGLNRLFEINASVEELTTLACELGSDVPFFLYQQPALCVGRGEIVKPLSFAVKQTPILVIKPSFGLSTKEIYQHYEADGGLKEERIVGLLDQLRLQHNEQLEDWIFNDLESVSLAQSADLRKLFAKLSSLGYRPHISGSGPSIFLWNASPNDLELVQSLDSSLFVYFCSTI